MTAPSARALRTARPPLRLEPVVEAARAALQLPGPARWTLDVRTDRVELRPVIRRRPSPRHGSPVSPAARQCGPLGWPSPCRADNPSCPTRTSPASWPSCTRGRWSRRGARNCCSTRRCSRNPAGPGSPLRTPPRCCGGCGPLPAADLRAGQAVETVRLAAAALGLDLHVLAAPATATAAIERCTGRTTDTLAVVQIGDLGCGPATS